MSEDGSSMLEIALRDEEGTRRLGAFMAALLRPGDLLLLEGPLGAGKTAFARALINALPTADGGERHEEVPSPTFTLVQFYESDRGPLWHFDLYRLEDPEELWELGWEEALAEGMVLVEWPERLGPHRPASALTLSLAYGDREAARRARVSGGTCWLERLQGLETGELV